MKFPHEKEKEFTLIRALISKMTLTTQGTIEPSLSLLLSPPSAMNAKTQTVVGLITGRATLFPPQCSLPPLFFLPLLLHKGGRQMQRRRRTGEDSQLRTQRTWQRLWSLKSSWREAMRGRGTTAGKRAPRPSAFAISPSLCSLLWGRQPPARAQLTAMARSFRPWTQDTGKIITVSKLLRGRYALSSKLTYLG